MKNIIYVIVIFFWILSMISKSRRQKEAAAAREKARKTNGPPNQKKRPVSQNIPAKKFSDDILAVFNEPIKPTVSEYESAYLTNDYFPEQSALPASADISVRGPVSHFEKNAGMQQTLGTESKEEKEAYDADQQLVPNFLLGSKGIRQYIVASEILGKPKALRRS